MKYNTATVEEPQNDGGLILLFNANFLANKNISPPYIRC